MNELERAGYELARQVHLLEALTLEQKTAMNDFAMRKETVRLEIARLAMQVKMQQMTLYPVTNELDTWDVKNR